MRFIFVPLLFFFSWNCYAAGKELADVAPPNRGNFSLPPSQQPGPLIGFGQNILNRDDTQLYLYSDRYHGANQAFWDLAPSLLYSVTDDFSIFIEAPIAAAYHVEGHHASGIKDSSLQLEYSIYSTSNSRFVQQATLVANATFPTGSNHKDPITGYGSMSYFLGGTLSRMYVDWYAFTSLGALLTTEHDHIQYGDNYLYQFGLGKNIAVINQWLFAWLLEIDGQFTEKNEINGSLDPNSGGNVIYLTPSLWISSKKLIFQLGAGAPVTQHLFGYQQKNNYLVAASVGLTL